MIKKLILLFLLLPSLVFADSALMGEESVHEVASGGVTCSGNFLTGSYESFEKGAGQFCTTGLVETDTEGVINLYDSAQSNCGSHSMHITEHSSSAGTVTATITDDNDFELRIYFRLDSITSDYVTASWGFLKDSDTNIEVGLRFWHNTGTDYRLFSVVNSAYFAISLDTWYYVVVNYLGDGTADGVIIKMYNTSGVAQSATGGYDSTSLSATITDGISSIVLSSTTTDFSVYIDDAIYSPDGSDLSGTQTCD